MSRFLTKAVTLTATVLLVMVFSSQDAFARIKCKGEFQYVKGAGWIATPYCQDTNLARVGQSYGFRYSAALVRNNPNVKVRLCWAIGHDIRVTGACAGYLPRGGRGRF